ncbi:transposable element Tcb1 transposase [Trichonephila clavipes]|nr:transposable element Tcb1 transposase [Trichonephila clavipes]
MTGHIYRDVILEQHVRLFRGAMRAEFLFMDDYARPHHANIIDECLQSEDITRMNWPSYSPDLNPIQHVWDMLGPRIAARQLPPTCLPELRRALLDEWCNISQNQIDNLILSMPRRIKACPYRVLDVKNNNVVIWKVGKRLTINVDQVRIYRHMKRDETEIGTGSSDNGSLRNESSGFDRVQRRSNELRDGKKKESEIKREWEEKGLSFRNNQERKVQKGLENRVKRNLSSNDSNSVLPRLRKINRREEKVIPTTSGLNLRPRKGKREESRLTIERKTQQGGPVRSRKGRERNDSPYIEE